MFAYCLDHKIKMTSGLYGRRGLIWGWACSIDVLKTLQKECDGKFDCRVQVVNKMFGDDPCSGESKILQYAWYCEQVTEKKTFPFPFFLTISCIQIADSFQNK